MQSVTFYFFLRWSIRHSLLFSHSRTSRNRKGREGWEGPPLTLSLCQSSYNSLYTCRNSIMLLQCMLDLSLHVSLKQGAPQWQMNCTLYCVITLYNLNLPTRVRGRRQAIWLAVTTLCTCNLNYNNNVTGPISANSIQLSPKVTINDPIVKYRIHKMHSQCRKITG